MPIPDHEIDAKKQTALGRRRGAAIEAIMPHVLGGLEHNGHAVLHNNRPPKLLAMIEPFQLALIVAPRALFVRVDWKGLLVLSAGVHMDCLGEYWGGRISVNTWERGAAWQDWQSALFDTFPRESKRLLTVPVSNMPNVLAEVLGMPLGEIQKVVWAGVTARSKHIVAQDLWRDLADACGRAGRAQITNDELGRVLVEFGLGLLASSRDKSELLNFTHEVAQEINGDGLSIVNAALQRNFWDPHLDAISWIRTLSGLDRAPRFWATEQMLVLGKVAAPSTIRKTASSQSAM